MLENTDLPGRYTEPNVNSIPSFIHSLSGVIKSTKSSAAHLTTYFELLMVRCSFVLFLFFLWVVLCFFFLNLDIQIYLDAPNQQNLKHVYNDLKQEAALF